MKRFLVQPYYKEGFGILVIVLHTFVFLILLSDFISLRKDLDLYTCGSPNQQI